VIPWKLAHAVLLAVQSSVDEFRQDFGLKLNWEAPMGSDLVYSILSPEWNADKTRVEGRSFLTAVARSMESICAGRSLWRRLDLWRRLIWSRGFSLMFHLMPAGFVTR
jgi:hypothetical protein